MRPRPIEYQALEYQQVIDGGEVLVALVDDTRGPSGLAVIRHGGKLYVVVDYESVGGGMWEFALDDLVRLVGGG